MNQIMHYILIYKLGKGLPFENLQKKCKECYSLCNQHRKVNCSVGQLLCSQ